MWRSRSILLWHLSGNGLAQWAEYDASRGKTTTRSLWMVGAWRVYVTIAISGACALGAQVIWTRLLSLMMGRDGLRFFDYSGGFSDRVGCGGAVWARILHAQK